MSCHENPTMLETIIFFGLIFIGGFFVFIILPIWEGIRKYEIHRKENERENRLP